MKITQYRPGFVESDERLQTAEVHTKAEIEALPFVKSWMAQPEFERLALTCDPQQSALSAVLKGGEHWVIGLFDGECSSASMWYGPLPSCENKAGDPICWHGSLTDLATDVAHLLAHYHPEPDHLLQAIKEFGDKLASKFKEIANAL